MSIRWRLLIIFLTISILPVLGGAFFATNSSEAYVRGHILENLEFAADQTEAAVVSFFETQKARVADWSSDGHIREEVAAIVRLLAEPSRRSEGEKRAQELGAYIRDNKMALDSTIRAAEIRGLDGAVIVSTEESAVGIPTDRPDFDPVIFGTVKASPYGMATITEVVIADEGHTGTEAVGGIHASVPIFSLDPREAVAVFTLHVSSTALNETLTGRRQEELGAMSGGGGRIHLLEAYMVNRERLMMTPSLFVEDAVLRQRVDTAPVRDCFEGRREMAGTYVNYLGSTVLGASMCAEAGDWALIVEMSETEAMAAFGGIKTAIFALTFLLAIVITFWSLLISGRYASRIRENLLALKEIGAGNFRARTSGRGDDEIGNEARQVNVVGEQLGKKFAEEHKLAAIVETGFETVLITDTKGVIRYVNSAWETLTGWKRDEVVGKATPSVLKSEKMPAAFYEELWSRLKAGKSFRGEMINRRKDGSLYDVEFVIFPRILPDGDEVYVDIGRDITAQKRDEAKLQAVGTVLRASEKRYRTLIESSPDCIQQLDADGKLLHLSRGGLAEHGFASEQEALDWDYLKTIDSRFLPEFKDALQRALRGKVASLDVRHASGPGIRGASNREWCNKTFSPIHDDSGKVTGVLSVSRDITAHKRDELRVSQLDALKNKFIQIVAHQLRTPLSAIRWNLEALLSDEVGKLKKEQKELLRVSYQANGEVIDRIRDLLTAMDIEEGRALLAREEVSINSVWNSALIDWKKQCVLKGLACINKPPKALLPAFVGDAEKLRFIFDKLMGNAVAYTASKGRLKTELKQVGDAIRFSVEDNGVGIPKGEQSHVFTRFFRASNAATMRPDSSGVGLFIAKHYVELHGGKIGFESKEGKGSTFWFEIPIKG